MRLVMRVGAGVVAVAAAIVAGNQVLEGHRRRVQPERQPLLLVSHEVSGSLRVYEIAPAK